MPELYHVPELYKCINVAELYPRVVQVWGLQKAEFYDACTGCQICAKVCPTDAIKGDLKMLHVVDLSKCISCGICVERCPVEGAMAMVDMTNSPRSRSS